MFGELAVGEFAEVAKHGRRFESVDDIYIFGSGDGKLVAALAVAYNLARLRQLGITPRIE